MDSTAYTLDQIRITIDRLRESWLWLGLLVVPGRETRGVGTVATDADREVQWYRAMHERAYKDWALRHGMGALAPTPAGARVSVIDAQVMVRGIVVDVARLVAQSQGQTYVGGAADTVQAVIDALDWLEEGARPAPWICWTGGVLHREGALDRIRDPELAAAVDTALQRADRVACEAARVDGDIERGAAGVVRERYAPIDGRCPACRNKSLQLVHDGDERNRLRWHVRCISERCVCVGLGDIDSGRPPCPCRQKARYAGRRHAWAYGELSGPYGLWAAMAAASPVRRTLRSATTGHGRWSDRRSGNAP